MLTVSRLGAENIPSQPAERLPWEAVGVRRMRNLIPASERFGFSRAEAAAYVGFGVTLFDAMVADGRMPKPKRVNSRKVWSRLALEEAFAELPEDGPAGQIQESADEWDAVA